MKIQAGQRISGNYTNGVTVWSFVGVVTSVRNDHNGGDFSRAMIELCSFEGVGRDLGRLDIDRKRLVLTLYNRADLEDSRFSNIEIENGTTTKIN